MSEDNVALARLGFEPIAGGDLEVIRALLHPDVRWHGGDPSAAGACRGSADVVRFLRHAIARGAVGQLVDVVDAGDQVVVVLRTPAADGAQPALRANVTTFRDGRVVEIVAYESPAVALAATGRPPGRPATRPVP